MKCARCKTKPADFYTKNVPVIRFYCAPCVWTSTTAGKPIAEEMQSLPTLGKDKK